MATWASQLTFFTGSESYKDITWPSVTFSSTSYQIVTGLESDDLTQGFVAIRLTNQTTTGVRVEPSATFSGTVYLLAYEA